MRGEGGRRSGEGPWLRGILGFVAHVGLTLRKHAKDMRRAPTRSENRLWSWLRNRRFDGYKFRRQYPIGRYVLDFYCAELKLAIEVDGRQHEDILLSQYDDARTDALQRQGVEGLRIQNELFIREPDIVEQQIRFPIESRR